MVHPLLQLGTVPLPMFNVVEILGGFLTLCKTNPVSIPSKDPQILVELSQPQLQQIITHDVGSKTLPWLVIQDVKRLERFLKSNFNVQFLKMRRSYVPDTLCV